MEIPIKMDDLGGTTIFGNAHISFLKWFLFIEPSFIFEGLSCAASENLLFTEAMVPPRVEKLLHIEDGEV